MMMIITNPSVTGHISHIALHKHFYLCVRLICGNTYY